MQPSCERLCSVYKTVTAAGACNLTLDKNINYRYSSEFVSHPDNQTNKLKKTSEKNSRDIWNVDGLL